jgi:hypothetical protein
MGLCESVEGDMVLESDLSKILGVYTLAEIMVIGCYNTFLDHSSGD